ncbi:hypothetical protein H8B02_11760 [Bradyrhizobium sp. Pear77]|uniref:hypothetical protein n=1 Tax=Bradyrhizobium altum TaxID=1571202 RepID=UPI001E3332C8|nr:hypothetical protein [Bradyrhizobium altum]MCC8954112.1 hypothetical protein [Bradyrhizobium altum]
MTIDPEKIFIDLPTDPLFASYELLQRIEKDIGKGKPSEADYSAACGYLEAFYETNNWKPPERLGAGGYSGSDTPDEISRKTRAIPRLQYEAYANQIMLNHRAVMKAKGKEVLDAATAKTIGYAVLEPDEKTAILAHIEKIRTLVEASGLDDRKKNNLFSRLAALTSEVNRNGTRTDRFFAFASELGFSIGQFTKDAKPAIDETKAILKIVTKARSRHEGLKLPEGDVVLSLPEPSAGE